MAPIERSSDDYAPGESFVASPNDPIVHGMRWQRELAEARVEVERLRKENARLRDDLRRTYSPRVRRA